MSLATHPSLTRRTFVAGQRPQPSASPWRWPAFA